MRIVLTGGGSGGHVYPLIAVARKIKELNPKVEIFYVAPFYQIEKDIFSFEGIKSYYILSGKLRRYFSILNFIDFLKMIIGFFQAIFLMLYIMPDVVFSKGGYGSVPITIVAWLYRIPIYLHESDAIPGLANSFLSRFAAKIFISFESADAYFKNKSVLLTGNPIREGLLNGSRKEALIEFKLDPERRKILILGGSQGSQVINDLILNSLMLLISKYDVIHQCGKNNFNDIKLFLKAARNNNFETFYRVADYFDERQLANLYQLADIVVSRAGAGGIFEIAANGKPSILIPLEDSANNHQKKNAYSYAASGATLVLEEENLTPNLFVSQIEKILDSDLKNSMAIKAKEFYKGNASEIIAKDILNSLGYGISS